MRDRDRDDLLHPGRQRSFGEHRLTESVEGGLGLGGELPSFAGDLAAHGGYIASDMGCLRSIVHPAEPMQAGGQRQVAEVNDRAPDQPPGLVGNEVKASPILEERQAVAASVPIDPTRNKP